MIDRTVVRPSHKRERTPWDSDTRRLVRTQKFLRFRYRTDWLRFTGAAFAGTFTFLLLAFLVIGVLATAVGLRGAESMWWLAGGCVPVIGMGLYVFSADRNPS